MREHTPQWGISCTPGGQERPKVAPLTYYGEGRPMKLRVFPTMVIYLGIFIEHNSASQCHRDMGWAYFTQATNQTLRIIVTVSNHALATI